MLFVSIFVLSATIYLYFDLFKKVGKDPFHAFIPILSFRTLCSVVEAMWSFYIYVVAFVGIVITALLTMLALCDVSFGASFCLVVLLLVKIFIYIRLYLKKIYDIKGVVLLIVLDIWRILVL